MTKFLDKKMTFGPPSKFDGVLDLDIWGEPEKQPTQVKDCDHHTVVYRVCSGWSCALCGERL